ncbi:putative ABC transport system permease protein [Arthrobacter sp. GAS37]|uniref:hypothetical protein n=1 Tax=Arthrobacter sp. GAS37 TaxID=3156261 RepID=UPI00383661DE
MKHVLLGLVIVVCAATFGVSVVNGINEERTAVARAAADAGKAFSVPSDAADPDAVLSALRSAAEATRSNVFRTVVGVDENDHAFVTQYVLLTQPDTRVFDGTALSSGRFLTVQESQEGDASVASSDTSPNTVGVLRVLGAGERFSFRPLRTAFDTMPAPGTYYAECGPAGCAAFMDAAAAALTTHIAGRTFVASDLSAPNPQLVVPTNVPPVYLQLAVFAGLLLTAVLAVYRQLYEAKRAGAMRLLGYGATRVWWTITGRPVIIVSTASGVALVSISALLPGADSGFAAVVVLDQIIAVGLLAATSLLTIPYVARMRASDALKNRRDTRALFGAGIALSVVTSAALVVVAAGAWSNVDVIDNERESLQHWTSTTGNGVFAPVSNGNDAVDLQTGQPGSSIVQATDLYDALSARGALYVYAGAFSKTALQQSQQAGQYRSMQVNPAYLRTYPIRDTNGQPITVDESESSWMLLVPEQFRSQEQEITAYFRAQRDSALSAEKTIFHRNISATAQDLRVRIIWTDNGQRIFTFNPDVAASSGGSVEDPIVEVITRANSLGVDRLNAVTGDASAGLKVPLVEGSSQATITALQPLLKRLSLDDNLRHLVTINEYQLARIGHLQESLRNTTIVLAALVVLLVIVTAQTLTIAFERFARKIIVRGLFGLSTWRRYREFIKLGAIVWAVQAGLGSGLVLAGFRPFSYADTGPLSTLTAAVAVSAVQGLVAVGVLWLTERRRTPNILKGEL